MLPQDRMIVIFWHYGCCEELAAMFLGSCFVVYVVFFNAGTVLGAFVNPGHMRLISHPLFASSLLYQPTVLTKENGWCIKLFKLECHGPKSPY